MKPKDCRATRREIDELGINEQPNEQALAHLAVCTECRGFRDERLELRALVGSLGRVAAPADFDMRLRARIARERRPSSQTFLARFIGTPAIVAAMLLVLVGASIVWLAQRSVPQPPTVARRGEMEPAPPKTIDSKATTAARDGSDSGSDLLAAAPSTSGPRSYRTPAPRSSRDFSVAPAPSVKQDSDRAFVNAPSRPVVVSLDDGRGATRKISLPPVSFGAQNLVDNRVSVNYSPNSRVW